MSLVLPGKGSLLPASLEFCRIETEQLASTINGRRLAPSNPVRRLLAAYSDCTGIEAGYSYFAPAVPGNSRLAFELHYPDGRTEYDVPVVSTATAGDRVSTLLDHVRFVQYARLREALLQSLVQAIHREHPGASRIRAVLGIAQLTTPAEYRSGKRVAYEPLYAYDFRYNLKIQPAAER